MRAGTEQAAMEAEKICRLLSSKFFRERLEVITA
jgi:hypothetical protein